MHARHLVWPILIALTWGIYGQVREFEFVNVDDDTYVTANNYVQQGLTWDNVKWAFTTKVGSNWHPLTWLSLMADETIADRLFHGNRAAVMHVVNVIWHTANTLLLFAVLNQMTKMWWRSAFVAALFAVHPLHVESVAWVAERKDVLSTFFGLLSIGLYVEYTRRQKWSWLGTSVTLFAVSLLAKQTLVTLPCLLLLLDYWPLQRISFSPSETANQKAWAAVLWEKVPYAVLTVVFCMTTLDAQTKVSVNMLPVDQRIANALIVYDLYLCQTIWPQTLVVFYPHPGNLTSFETAAWAGLLLVMVTAGVSFLLRNKPYLAVGWFWYLGTLVPMIGLVQVGAQRMADRYTYFPLIGIFIAVTWLVCDLVPARSWRTTVLSVVGGSLVTVYSFCAFVQTSYWQNSIALFTHALKIEEFNDFAHNGLGAALWAAGRKSEALEHFRNAVRIRPEFGKNRYNLGLALADLGESEAAERQFLRVIENDSEYADAHFQLGKIYDLRKRLDLARPHFEKYVRLFPDDSEALYRLGKCEIFTGAPAAGENHLRQAIALDPGIALYHNMLGNALGMQGNYSEAAKSYRQALQLDPTLSAAQENLADAERRVSGK